MKQNLAPFIIAVVLVVLLPLYIGSYLALVIPEGRDMWMIDGDYRWQPATCAKLFWPGADRSEVETKSVGTSQSIPLTRRWTNHAIQ